MPGILLERYVSEMDSLEAASLLDMATANDYAGWQQSTRETWWNAQERRVRQSSAPPAVVPAGTPRHRTSGFFWNGQAIRGGALKQNLASALGGGFGRD